MVLITDINIACNSALDENPAVFFPDVSIDSNIDILDVDYNKLLHDINDITIGLKENNA